MGTTGYLLDNIKVTAEAPTATGTTTITSTTLDMAGYDAVMWICRLGTPASNNGMKAQQDTVSNMASVADLKDSLVSDASDNVLIYDLKNPDERYVRAAVVRGTTTTIDSLVAIQYRSRSLPITQASSVTAERATAPIEGTA
jgi:hypothetical protein